MRIKAKILLQLSVLLIGGLLAVSPVAVAATGQMSGADEVARLSVLNVEDKVDCTLSYLRVEKEMDVPSDFKTATGFMSEVEARADADGLISTELSDKNLAENKVIKAVCDTLLGRAVIYQDIVLAIRDNVDDVSPDYCEMWEAFEEAPEVPAVEAQAEDYDPVILDDPTDGDDDGDDEGEDGDEDSDIDAGNFIFYGKDYEVTDDGANADDDVYLAGNGVISFTGPFAVEDIPEDYLPAVAPLLILEDAPGAGDGVSMADNIFDAPQVFGGASAPLYRYAYNTGDGALTEPFSATLYEDQSSEESDWIAMSFGSGGYNALLDQELETSIFVGLIPGDGSADHPGPGASRDRLPSEENKELDLSMMLGDSISGDEFLWLYEEFDGDVISDGEGVAAADTYDEVTDSFDLTDTFLVFRPDGDNKYRIIAGRRDMVVDSLGLDGTSTVLDMAIENMMDASLRDTVDAGEFLPGVFDSAGHWYDMGSSSTESTYWSGNYEFGLQTVGTDRQRIYGDGGMAIQANGDGMPYLFSYHNVSDPAYVGDDSASRINRNGFLAYAVQLEEDIVNEKILERLDEQAKWSVAGLVNDAREVADIRARDAWFARNADAQSGRVTKDHNGNWVRAQQYVLRNETNGNTSVQVVNASLRGNSELSTMVFETNLVGTYNENLTLLPWNKWLETQIPVEGDPFVYTDEASPELAQMSVRFTNANEEYLQESRIFQEGVINWDDFSGTVYAQKIDKDMLETARMENGTLSDPTTFTRAFYSAAENDTYTVEPDENGFEYVLGDGNSIDVSFYALGDGEYPWDLGVQNDNAGNIKDIWDAMRVNEGGSSPDIGSNVLEIAIDQGSDFFEKPINVVYIPMSRMLWKDSPE